MNIRFSRFFYFPFCYRSQKPKYLQPVVMKRSWWEEISASKFILYMWKTYIQQGFFFSKLELQLARYLFAYDQSCLWAEPGYNVFIENFMVFIFYYTDALPSCQRYFSRFKRATSYTCRQRQTMLIVKTNLANLSNRIRQTCNEFNFKVKQLL